VYTADAPHASILTVREILRAGEYDNMNGAAASSDERPVYRVLATTRSGTGLVCKLTGCCADGSDEVKKACIFRNRVRDEPSASDDDDDGARRQESAGDEGQRRPGRDGQDLRAVVLEKLVRIRLAAKRDFCRVSTERIPGDKKKHLKCAFARLLRDVDECLARMTGGDGGSCGTNTRTKAADWHAVARRLEARHLTDQQTYNEMRAEFGAGRSATAFCDWARYLFPCFD